MKETLFKDGEFFVGCNYWASHSGTNMWHDWCPDTIEKDLVLLKEANIKILRVFPLWSDFQPIKMLTTWKGLEKEIRMGEDILPFTEEGRAGVSEVMADRFEMFCDIAEKHGMKLVVGLITGWMSGRLYVPELFEGVNLLTDSRAIKWQIKFVKYMVKRFKERKCIVAWDLGNECDCLAPIENSDDAYLWASTITMAIKTEDNIRPVISGMHACFPESEFCAQNLGEILDVLCTHPYPLFTAHCMTDPIVDFKSVMHSTAQTLMFRGVGKKPAFVEEIGTLGPMLASDENAAAYINTVLYLLWSHNCLGLMWWCGFEQKNLTHAPYDWETFERELGLFYDDYSPKPVLGTISDFAEFIKELEYKKLPERIVDAVCIINAQKDTWKSTYGTFLLAKQAGLDIEFCYAEDEIPVKRAYIIPSVAHSQLKKHVMDEIMSRVENGAILYISMGNGLLSPFNEITGLKSLYRYKPTKPDVVKVCGEEFSFMPEFKVDYAEESAEILAYDDENRPVMSKKKYGKGIVYYLGYNIEDMAAAKPGITGGNGIIPYYKFYELMKELKNNKKIVTKDNPFVGITEHIIDEETRLIVAVNCTLKKNDVKFVFDGYRFSKILKNQGARIKETEEGAEIRFLPNSAVVFEIKSIS